MDELCQPTTEFTFWYHDIQENEKLPADEFAPLQQRNVHALAFHMLLASRINTSMIVLNNTIQARPADDVDKCIRLNLMLAVHDTQPESRSKQIILVDHNADEEEPIFDGQFKRIRCNLRDSGRITITDSFHR